MSLYSNFTDLANSIKSALEKKADKTEIPQAGSISSGDTGYATGGDVYAVVGNVEASLSAINTALADLIGGES